MSIYIGSNRYKAMVGSSRADFVTKKALPYDAEIEYLEGKGAQYINTGILPTNETSWYLRLQRIDTTSSDEIPLGSRNSGFFDFTTWTNPSTNKGFAAHYPYDIRTGEREDSSWVYKGDIINTFHEMKVSPLKITIDGIDVHSWTNTTRPTFQSSYPLHLFALRDGQIIDQRIFKGRISATKIWLSDVLVFDAIPVRKGTTGYMYDKVSGTLFGNKGTGSFVLGPDKN